MKARPFKAREFAQILSALGYEFSRQKGTSHAIYTHPQTGHSLPVADHGARDIPGGTLASAFRAVAVHVPDAAQPVLRDIQLGGDLKHGIKALQSLGHGP